VSKPENKIKRSAKDRVKRAVKSGKLIRLPCEICGDKKSQGHHEDYNKPLDVLWLCAQHHRDRHMELKS